jgi:hypothetical protein
VGWIAHTSISPGIVSMASLLEPQQDMLAEQRFVIRGVDWDTYDKIVHILGDRPSPRLTFDGRNLELMSPSPAHELYKTRFGRLLEALAYELNVELLSGGSTTFRRQDVAQVRQHFTQGGG